MIAHLRRAAVLPGLRLFLLACCVASLLSGGPPARAENLGPGGGTRIIIGDEVVGPYRLLVTGSPEPAYPGTLTFIVRVSDPVTDEKVLDAVVYVELVHEAGALLTAQATHADAGNAVDYAAHMGVEQTGAYDGTIRIAGPAGAAEVRFLQQVAPRRTFAGVFLAGFPFLVVLAILGGIWYARAGHRSASG